MTFTPPRTAIAAISNAYPAVVTTETLHGLSTGVLVRMHVPQAYGMDELNQKIFSVSVIDPLNFSLQYSQVAPSQNVDSRYFSAFVIPETPSSLTAEVLCVGAGPTPTEYPLVYFQNNVCTSQLEDATQNISY